MIGIRREDKSEWEGRAPLVPNDIRWLHDEHGVDFHVETSPTRAIKDKEYRSYGAAIVDDLSDCPIIMGVKEIPPERLRPGKVYVYFAHVIKGQPHNMPVLRRLMELGCTLIDYERIVDDQNRRLVFFGRYAGLAGMIDSLWAFGQRLLHEGIESPFAQVRPAHLYDDLEHVKREFAPTAEAIRTRGLPTAIDPLVCGFAGYGNVSQGAQAIYDLLPVEEIAPEQLASLRPNPSRCYKVVFHERHMVVPREPAAPFDLQEYFSRPERYRGVFFQYAPYLSILINGIYWEEKYPRLITREQFKELWSAGQPRLRVVGDISCDIDGSLACTTHATDPANPLYVYDPFTGQTTDGVAGRGPVVLAVDFLPCELPVDASNYFSHTLSPFIPALARADFSAPLAESGLPPELQRATVVYQGRLTGRYSYLEQYLHQP